MLEKKTDLVEGAHIRANTGPKTAMSEDEILEQTGTDATGQHIVMGAPEVDGVPVASVEGVETSIAKVLRTGKPVRISK